MPTPSLIIPSAPVYDEGLLYGLNVYGTNFVPEPIPFTRATTATRTNAAGLIELAPYNLLRYSEQFDNAAWEKNNSSVIPNISTAPNGTLTADKIIPNLSGSVRGVFVFGNAINSYNFSVYAKAGGKNFLYFYVVGSTASTGVWFNLNTGTIGTIGSSWSGVAITSVGDGWYRCSANVSLINSSNNLYYFVSDTNGSLDVTANGTDGLFLWGAQLVEGTSALPYLKTETRLNRPRVDFSLGGCPNLLLEPQRTNLALQSSSFDTTWTKVSVSVAANSTTSPSGVTDADTITSTTTSQALIVQLPTIVSGTNYTISFYVKQNTQRFVYIRFTAQSVSDNYVSAVFDLQDGTVGQTAVGGTSGTLIGTKVETAANGFYRISLTASINITSANFGIGFAAAKTGNTFSNFGAITDPITNGNSVFLWGAQLEAGAYATSYIPTTTASVTRNADNISRSNIYTNGLITDAGGTWFVELRNNRSLQRDNTSLTLNLVDTSGFGNNAWYFRNSGANRLSIGKTIAGVFTVSLYTTTTDTCKIAIKWNGSTADIFENGLKVIAATPFTGTAMENLLSSPQVATYINSMILYPTPLSDTECINLTTL